VFSPKAAQRILVADDDDFVRRILRDHLTREGYRVDLVPNGAEALKKVKSTKYSLLLLDLEMGHPTGLEVIAELRAEGNGVGVILMSGSFTLRSLKDMPRDAAVSYLTKPFTAVELERAIEGRIGRTIAIPCRHCGVAIPFAPQVGVTSLRCPSCAQATQVRAEFEAGEFRVRTEPE
jgi:DNA-binding response OmpR family regulator